MMDVIFRSFLIALAAFIASVELKFDQCMFDKPVFNPELEVTRFGSPTPFVYTRSSGVSPYNLIDPYRQSAVYHEYILIGPGLAVHSHDADEDHNVQARVLEQGSEEMQLLLYDETAIHRWENDPNLVEQNLLKEYFWALINATGMLPSLTLVNTTFEKSFRFHTEDKDNVAYHLIYPNLFRSRETLPPMDVLIEFPAKTRMFQSLKTMIDYQTFGLLRWRITPSDIVTWDKLRNLKIEWTLTIEDPGVCRKPPADLDYLTHVDFLRCIYFKRLRVLENPCIKDMVILYIIRGQKGEEGVHSTYFGVNKVFLVIPMVYDLLSYQGYIDLTEAYCPRPEEAEECGEPLDIVLTNDHLLILTDKALWVSNSLNVSNANATYPYSMKPLLKFEPINPCVYLDYFNCSAMVGMPILGLQTFRRQRLFYTPICHLFQYPLYEDIVIFVIEHVTQAPDLSEERDALTILYAAKPYNNWKMLFHAKYEYISKDGPLAIAELLGIFYNHQRRHFDMTLLLRDMAQNGEERTIRFVLPIPTDPEFKGYRELNGLLGNGFLEFEFPPYFRMSGLSVNPEPLDIFFLGNQIWIAEAGGPFVYVSIPYVSDENERVSYISHCSFNHPDRTYVCLERNHQVMYTGRLGTTYTSISHLFSKINELRFTMLYNVWPFSFRQYTAMLGNFVVGYSGKVMLWYVHDPNDLSTAQEDLAIKLTATTNPAACDNPAVYLDQPVKCHVCRKLAARIMKYGCVIANSPNDQISFKMIAFDVSKLTSRGATTDGPIIPFILDGDKMVMFEAVVPDLPHSKPRRDYFTELDVGSKLYCPVIEEPFINQTFTPTPGTYNVTCPIMSEAELQVKCHLYIKFMKNLERKGEQAFLKKIRRVFYADIIQPFTLRPVPVDLVILILPDSNEAIVQLDTGMFDPMKEYTFTYDDVGQTLFVPEHFSVLLAGFPKFQECNFPNDPLLHDMTRMVGIATRYYRRGARIQLRPFEAFIIDFSTPQYCMWYKDTLRDLNTSTCTDAPHPSDIISGEYRRRREESNANRLKEYSDRSLLGLSINAYYTHGFYGIGQVQPNLFQPLQALVPSTYQDVEDELLKTPVPAVGSFATFHLEMNRTYNPDLFNPEKYINNISHKCSDKIAWELHDGGCHLRLALTNNPVLKQSGGRISLDKFDSLSFQVKLRALTPVGRALIHRPLISVTNTNPDVLVIEQTDTTLQDVQILNITLTPSGFREGVATVSIRPLIVSGTCLFAEGSFTLIVQVQRALGRRLHVNYPVPTCKPEVDSGEYERPWKIDLPQCVTRYDLLTKHEVKRPEDDEIGQVFYSELPANYRPPSRRGVDIPLSKIVYNTDPEKPWYKEVYRISKETGELGKCEGKMTKEECECSVNDELSDDEIYSDCKRMVYTAKRGFRVDISLEYDRIMRDEDQHFNFFSPKNVWAVHVDEINERAEFTLSSETSPYLQLINNDTDLNQGHRYYDAKTLGVTLHGTGLFHFKATLGDFESFHEVSGYFIIFIPDTEFNHVKLIVIMLLTITICMVFVFCGFLLVRRQLSSQLPFQAQITEKIKLE